jgi:hypothetical protein
MNHETPAAMVFSRALPEGPSVGMPIAEFTFSWKRKAIWATLGFVAVVGGVALLAFAWFSEERSLDANGRSRAKTVGFLAIGCGAVLLFNALRIRRLHVWVGTAGVVLLENDAVQTAGWPEMVTLWDSKITDKNSTGLSSMLWAAVRGEERIVTVDCHDGKRLVFKSFLGDIGRLAKIIKRETLGHLLLPVAAILEARGEVQFGPVAVSAQGMIQKDACVLPWTEIKDVVNKDGLFKVSTRDKWLSWLSCSQGEIPNVHVLMFLVDKYHISLSRE